MKRRMSLVGVLLALLWATPVKADTGVIVRTTGGLTAVQALCLLPATCTVVGGLDGTLGQVFLVRTPLPLQTFLSLLPGSLTGFVDAEVNQLLNLIGGLNVVPTPISPTLMQDRSSTPYPANSTTQTAWNSYVNQPAASIVGVQNAQKTFNVTGNGIIADIDTGVDPTHPVLQPVLVPGDGYDFTRNQQGGSELNDLSPCPFPSISTSCSPPTCTTATCPSPAQVNQSSAAILDQSSAAILDGNSQYKAFGHGTMIMGIIHLVAPTAQLMPLKAFHSDGTASLSDILRAIYYGVQNGANVINMSFDTKTSSAELQKALDYANQKGVICAASSGNDGQGSPPPPAPPFLVYPAAFQNDVMGVASTSDQDTRSSFSNYGSAIVWVAAPGEAIVSTYPFDTYAAGWGTSFSAPFVSGGAALLHNLRAAIGQSGAATAVANAVPLDPSLGLNHGRLDLVTTLGSLGGTPDYTVSASPSSGTINAGQQTNFTVSAAPANGFDQQTVTWSCTGAPAAASCTVSPSSVTVHWPNPATGAVTLSTKARGLATPLVLPRAAPTPHLWATLAAAIFAWLAVLLTLRGLSGTSRLRPGLAAAAGALAVSLCTYSCAGGYSSPNPPGSLVLLSVTVNPTSVTGGSSSTGTVTLSGPAASGAAVYLSSSASSATVPASVTVAAGASSAAFTVNTSAVTTSTPVTITASYAGTTQTAVLTVTPPSGTPAGTYTLTITGTSGNLSHATTVQVTVN